MKKSLPSSKSSLALTNLFLVFLLAALSIAAPPAAAQPIIPEAARYDCKRILNGPNVIIDGCCTLPGTPVWRDCRGVCFGPAKVDACGICEGPGLNQYGCCGTLRKDCHGICGGTGVIDVCGICGGPGLNQYGCCGTLRKDCSGSCGTKVVDVCGICGGPGLNSAGCCGSLTKDCKGVCGGPARVDVCGVCGGPGLNSAGCCGSLTKDCKGVCGGPARVDVCGVCGGPGLNWAGCCGSQVKDCAGVCGGSKTVDVCGVCGGSGLNGAGCCGSQVKDCNGVCGGSAQSQPYWTFHHATTGAAPASIVDFLPSLPVRFAIGGGSNTGVFQGIGTYACEGFCGFQNWLFGWSVNCYESCMYSDWFMKVTDNDWGAWSGCHGAFTGKIGNLWTFFQPITTRYDTWCNEITPNSCYWEAGGHNDYFTFNVIKIIDTIIFGIIWAMFPGLGFSPVSLDWDASLDQAAAFNPAAYHAPQYVEEEAVYTQFPLDPNSPGKWVLWRASDKAPLLVYDPSHAGKITSAEQLFGNFTFGKRWKHGYEPMATLDANGDQELTGDELKDLALWFDMNRNGISEPGEVKMLTEKGVTKLYFKPQSAQLDKGMLIAPRGYTRRVGSHDVLASSRDWFTSAFDKKVAKDTFIKRGFEGPDLLKPKPEADALSEQGAFSGVWNWKVDKAIDTPVGPFSPSGRLTFIATNTGFVGTSEREVPPELRNEIKLVSARLAGKLVKDGQADKLQFTVDAGGQLVHSTAELLADGTLHGISEVEGGKDDKTGEIFVISYSWTANKGTTMK